jgi:hypothetical protein
MLIRKKENTSVGQSDTGGISFFLKSVGTKRTLIFLHFSRSRFESGVLNHIFHNHCRFKKV